MAKNLILYGKSSSNLVALRDLEEVGTKLEDCAIVLMEDAIYVAVQPIPTGDDSFLDSFRSRLVAAQIPTFYIEEDLQARGLTPSHVGKGLTPISYLSVIDLIDSASRVISML